MDKLWAPWRIEYVRQPQEEECIFCAKPQQNDDRETLILFRGNQAFVLMNLYPYSNGHLMVAPYRHCDNTEDLETDTLTEIMTLANHSMAILRKTMRAEGFNFGVNVGRAAGAGIEEHVHYHLVPRWAGDTNYMPILGHTKVIVEGLQETYDLLKPEFDRLS